MNLDFNLQPPSIKEVYLHKQAPYTVYYHDYNILFGCAVLFPQIELLHYLNKILFKSRKTSPP